ncbi:MAG: transporter [Planctomycetes bacterium]|nr:transporter [Planctomycetota bacterium]
MGDLALLDVAVLAATLLLAVAAGLLLGRKAASAQSFLAGERDVPWGAVLLSIVATETSSVTFLSIPGVAWGGDLRFLQLPLGYLIGRVVVAHLLLPRYFEGQVLTSYEVLGRRFGPGVKRASSLLFLVTRTLGDGLRLYLTALPLQLLTGWPLEGAAALLVGVTLAYTWFGGVRAVVWTDAVQFFIYVGGGVLALAVAIGDTSGGLAAVLERADAAGKLRLFDGALDFTRTNTLLAGLLGGAFLTLATHGTDQLMVQRYLCAKGQREAGRALVASGVVVLLQFALFLLLGLALHAWFTDRPPATPFAKGDEVFPAFIVGRLRELPGAVGLILGALFAVSMSTLSSSLNASASALVNDFGGASGSVASSTAGSAARDSDAARLRRARAATVLFALLQGALALSGTLLTRSVVDVVLQIASFTSGITLGLFLLARQLGPLPDEAAARAVDARAALVAFTVGLAGMTVVWRATPLAWPWYALVGSLGTLAVGLLARRVAKG